MNSKLGIALIIALLTGCLSLGQAWAVRGRSLSSLKHLLVWVTACALSVALGFALVGMQRDAAKLQAEIVQLGILAGIISGISLLVAARFKGRAAAAADSFTEGAMQLAGVHSAFVVLGGCFALAAFDVLRLAQIRW